MLWIMSVVAFVFCRQLRRSSALDYQDIHRESGDAGLIRILAAYISDLKDGALRRNLATGFDAVPVQTDKVVKGVSRDGKTLL